MCSIPKASSTQCLHALALTVAQIAFSPRDLIAVVHAVCSSLPQNVTCPALLRLLGVIILCILIQNNSYFNTSLQNCTLNKSVPLKSLDGSFAWRQERYTTGVVGVRVLIEVGVVAIDLLRQCINREICVKNSHSALFHCNFASSTNTYYFKRIYPQTRNRPSWK